MLLRRFRRSLFTEKDLVNEIVLNRAIDLMVFHDPFGVEESASRRAVANVKGSSRPGEKSKILDSGKKTGWKVVNDHAYNRNKQAY